MTIIATDWADFYGGRQENFLMQQMRNLANPGNGSVARGSPLEPKIDPVTGHLVGMDKHHVTSERVGDRLRFHLHRGTNPLPLPPLAPKEMPWGWAEDFAHNPENFKVHTLRGNDSPGMYHVSGELPLDAYRVEVTRVDGRVRYDLCPVVGADAQPSIFD